MSLALALLLAGCATCTMNPDGTVTGKAFGNSACSVCPRTLVQPPRAATDPIPPPIVPTVKDGCMIVQGGAETGTTVTTVMSIIGAFLAGFAL